MVCRLLPCIRALVIQCDDVDFVVERPRGFLWFVVRRLRNGPTFDAGVLDGDIVVRINDSPAWELDRAAALMLLLGDEDAATVRIAWIPAAQMALAVRCANGIRGADAQPIQWPVAAPRSPEARERHRLRNRHASMTPEQVERHRQRNVHDNMTPEQVERHRRRNLHDEMDAEQIDRHRRRNLHDEMGAEQIEQHRQRNIHENMDAEQIDRHRQRAAQLVLPRDFSIRLNYGTRCDHCGFRYLMHETSKDLCCGHGKATRPPFPALPPLSANIRRFAMEYPGHVAQHSFQYNNVFAFGIIGVDNGDPNAPGFPRPQGGPSCIKIHGRTYHRVATADRARSAVR